ncbi:MAG: lysylphosphatidylglycerol synthase transmembrane domain-containing protein [Chloroflexota bacterium]
MKRANLGRSLIILALAAFFVYRYFQLPTPSVLHLVYAITLGGLGLLGLANLLPAHWQNIALNLGVSLFFLDFVFAEINPSQVGQALAQANYWMFVPSTVCLLVHLYFRTLRWQWLLKPLGEVPFWPAFRGLVIGITGNAVLPARAGEFLRAYVLGRSTGLSKTGVFATLVVERIFDGLTVLLVLVAVVSLGVRNEALQTVGILGGVFYLGAMVGLIVFMTNRRWIDLLVNKLLPHSWAQRVLSLLESFSRGLAVLKNPGQLGMVILWNTFTWVMIPISFWFGLLAFDFGTALPWQASILMLPLMALGLTIPGAPGGLGAVQAAIKLTLDISFAGLPVAANFAETVAAATILIHLSQFLPEIIPGFISFFIEGLTTRDLSAGRGIAGQPQVPGGR